MAILVLAGQKKCQTNMYFDTNNFNRISCNVYAVSLGVYYLLLVSGVKMMYPC